jgi:hypothetical protein
MLSSLDGRAARLDGSINNLGYVLYPSFAIPIFRWLIRAISRRSSKSRVICHTCLSAILVGR